MTITEKGFSAYLEEQRERHGFRKFHFRRLSDIVQTAQVYSCLDGEGAIPPNYSMAVYCVGLFIQQCLPEDAVVQDFEETTEEMWQFQRAYQELSHGPSMRTALEKLKAVADTGNPEAVRIYGDLMITVGRWEELGRDREQRAKLPALRGDAASLAAQCFSGRIQALLRLADILRPGSEQYPEIRKSQKLSALLTDWAVAMMEKAAREDPFAMMELYNYYLDAHNKSYAAYWLRRALSTGYHLAKYRMALNLFNDAFTGHISTWHGEYTDTDTGGLDTAIAYLKEIQDLGYDEARDQIQACKKLKKEIAASARARQEREYREMARTLEADMAAYREKLDRREWISNAFLDDIPLTDREAGDLFFCLRDYETAMDYYARGLFREAAEKRYLRKQIRQLEDEDLIRKQEEAAERRSREARTAPVDYQRFRQVTEELPVSPMFPPADKAELQDKEFLRLYADCSAYRQANRFEEAEAAAEKLTALFPESCMARWLHFLAVNGIVFEESFEVYNICRMINDSYFYNEDYLWIMAHAGEGDREVYQRFFARFEERRLAYMTEQDQAALYRIVFCYCGTGPDGKKSRSAAIAEQLITRWESSHSANYPVHCYAADLYRKTFVDTFEEARTYGALRNARILVLIAETEEELFGDEMWNQWKRYYEWSLSDSGKQIVAVSTGQLNEVYAGITEFVREVHGKEDMDQLYQLLESKRWGLDVFLDGLSIPPEGRTEDLTKLVQTCLAERDVDWGLRTESNFLGHMRIYAQAEPDPEIKSDSFSVIEIEDYLQLAFVIHLRKPLPDHYHAVYTLQLFDSENHLLVEHSWDFGEDNRSIDQFAVKWGLKNQETGELYFTPGLYRARARLNEEEPLDSFFQLTWRAGQGESLDRMARDMNLVPGAGERDLPQEELRQLMRHRAQERYLSRVEKCQPANRTTKSHAIEAFVKGIFKTKMEYGHSAEIREDGTVHVKTCDHKRSYKTLPVPFNDEGIARDVAQMRNIIEVACSPRGVFALDGDGQLHYAGRDPGLKEEVRRLGRVEAITEGDKNGEVYALDDGGRLLELGPDGVTVKEEGVRAFSTVGFGNNIRQMIYINAQGDVCPNNWIPKGVRHQFIALECCGQAIVYLSDCGRLYFGSTDVIFRLEQPKNKALQRAANRLQKAHGIVSFRMTQPYVVEAHLCDGRTETYRLKGERS